MSGRGPNERAHKQMRQRIAGEAARIMIEDGVKDFRQAKRKAAQHLGAMDTQNMPRNAEIEEAVREYQRLFRSDTQPRRLRELREAALEAMDFFADFQPRLAGSVLRGTAGEHSDVNLHLFASTPEEVELFLMNHNIPYKTGERRFRYGPKEHRFTVYRFVAGENVIELLVFPLDGTRHAPPSPVDGKPMPRASVSTVRKMLDEDQGGDGMAEANG